MDDRRKSRFNIGVAGFLDRGEKEDVTKKIAAILHEIRTCVSGNETRVYKAEPDDVILDLYACPLFIDELWTDFSDTGTALNMIFPGNDSNNAFGAFMEKCASTVKLSVAHNRFGVIHSMMDWVTAQIDIALVIWDGIESSRRGYIWTFIEQCKRNHTPCIWIDVNDPRKTYWFQDSYYEDYSSALLSEYIERLYPGAAHDRGASKNPFLSSLWGKLYDRYIAKYNATLQRIDYMDDVADTDEILGKNYQFETDNAHQRDNYTALRGAFHSYDNEAVELSKKYRSSIYFRSILPLISIIFTAIAFNIETIFGVVCNFTVFGLNVWTILAGVSFFASAAINLYGYYMSENEAVQACRTEFLSKRYVAEYLRVVIHFLPFGVTLKENILHKAIESDTAQNRDAVLQIRRILRERAPVNCRLNAKTYKRIIGHLLSMIKEQQAYHARTKRRYENIAAKLGKYADAVFWIGFVLVILRFMLQFVLAFIGDKQGWPILNNYSLDELIRTFANMLALTIPAWASYFSLKLSLNNFNGLCEHSGKMMKNLSSLQTKVNAINEQDTISYGMLRSLSEDVLLIHVSELDDWYAQTAARSVTKL